MALDLFNVYSGLGLLSEDLTSTAHILHGAGFPSGTLADAAPVGSLWHDTTPETDKLQIWWKHTAGAGLDKWEKGASTSYVDAAIQGISWREPARVQDMTLYASSAAFPVTGIIDGVTLVDGDRVLFSNVTNGAHENVWIWDSGTSTWSEDTNQETDGDAIFIQEGTNAEQQWMYDGTNWFQFGGSSSTEILYIRNFIGKDTAGNNYPNYVSEDIVSDGQDLRLGISSLDDSIGLLQFTNNYVISDFTPGTIQDPDLGASTTSVTDITDALNKLDSTYGSGDITNTTSFYPLTADMQWFAGGTLTLTGAYNALNNAIGPRDYTGNILTDGQTITQSLEEIDVTIGDIDNSSAYTTGGYLSTSTIAGNSVQQTFDSFNLAIGNLSELNYTNTGSAPVSTTTPLEPSGAQLATSEATEVIWHVQVKDSASKRQAFKVHFLTDGTNVDHTVYGVIKTGGNMGGSIGFNVTISGGNIVPSLTPSSGAGALTFTIKRMSYSYLA